MSWSTIRRLVVGGEPGVVAEDAGDVGDVPAALAHGACRSGASPRGPSPRGRDRCRSRDAGQERGALGAGRARPVAGVEGAARGRDRGLDLVVGRDVHLGHDRAVGRVDHGAARAVARGDPRTVDEQVRQRVPHSIVALTGAQGSAVAGPSSRRRTACQAGRVHPVRPPRYPSRVDPTRPDGADRHPSPHPDRLWRHPDPKPAYEVVIVGGGGHGLATAYYLAKRARHHRRRRARARLARRREHRPQHDDHPLELPLGRERRRSTSTRSSSGRGSRRSSTTTCSSASAACSTSRTRCRTSATARGASSANRLNGIDAEWLEPDEVARGLPDPERLARRPLPGARRDLPAARRDRPARERRLGLRARRRRARRRPHPGLRGDRASTSRAAASSGGRDVARPDRRGQVALVAAGHSSVLAGDGRACGCRSRATRSRRSSRSCYEQVLDTVVMSNAVHVYVSQAHKGELVHGRRHRRLQLLRAARLVPRDRAPAGRRARAVPDLRARARAADVGRHRRRLPGRLADRRADAGRRASTSTAAGAPAASRRRPARAGCSPTRSRTASRTRSTRRSRSTASRPAR